MKATITKNPLEVAKGWFEKISFIKSQITALEKLEQYPIIRISVLLLKAQLIEFEIKQLIFSFDLHLHSHNNSSVLKRKIRTPRYLDDMKLTLGSLIQELRQFDSEIIEELLMDLRTFNRIRVKFVHYLLDSSSTIEDLSRDSKTGIGLANKIFKKMENIDDVIKKIDHPSKP